MQDLAAALTLYALPSQPRRDAVRAAIASGEILHTRWLAGLAAAVEDPALAELVVVEVVPVVGAPLAALLRAAFDVNGDLPDLFRLRGVLAVEGENACDLLRAALHDGSALLREGALACVAASVPGAALLEGECVQMLSPSTKFVLEHSLKWRWFSLQHGLPCDAALTLLQRVSSSSPSSPSSSPPLSLSLSPSPSSSPLLKKPSGPGGWPQPSTQDRAQTTPLLAAMAASTDPVACDAVVAALALCGDGRAFLALLQRLRSGSVDAMGPPASMSDQGVVGALLSIGGALGLGALLETLKSAAPDSSAFYALIDGLVAVGGDAVEGALAHKLAACANVPGAPGAYLVAVLPMGIAVLPLIALLQARGTCSDVRCAAAERLGALHDPRIVPALQGQLRDHIDDVLVATSSVEALQEQGDRSALDCLVWALPRARDAALRTALVRALGSLCDPRARLILLQQHQLDAADADFASAVVTALGRLRDPSLLPLLTTSLARAQRFAHRRAVLAALGHLGAVARPVLELELGQPLYERTAPPSIATLLRATTLEALTQSKA